MNYISIGKRIAEIRKKKEITQESLAEMLDSSPTYISNIERAAKQPSLGMLVRIANVLEVSLDYLVLDNFSNDKIKDNIELQEIICKLQKLSTENKCIYWDICNSVLDRLILSEGK